MDDDVNKSSDSLPTSEEYEFVGSGEPELHIAGNGGEDQLKQSLREVLNDTEVKMHCINKEENSHSEEKAKMPDIEECKQTVLPSQEVREMKVKTKATARPLLITKSTVESVSTSDIKLALYTTSPSPADEDRVPLYANLADGEYTVFDRIIYLGCATIADPTSEIEIQKNMAVLNGQSSAHAMHVSLSLPVHSEGLIVLYEPSTSNEIASFPILRIKACVPGNQESKEAHCLALLYDTSQNNVPESTVFQCHVFRCEVPEAVSKIMQCFVCATKKFPKAPLSRTESFSSDRSGSITSLKTNVQTYVFEAAVEFKEEDMKGNFSSCPKDKDYFKLRCKLEKSISVTVQQVSDNKELVIERCFGLLISPGRNVRSSDMQLIEMISFNKSTSNEKTVYSILGMWDPNEPVFDILNTETPRDTRVYMTIAVDLVICGIQEPVRFVIETKAKLLPQNERFWYFTKKALYEQFYLRLREVDLDASGDYLFHVISLDSTTQLQRKKASLSLNLNLASRKSSLPSSSSPGDPDTESDNDEPLLSGTGEVSKDCTETELEGWAAVLAKWRQNLTQRPRQLSTLVKRGIPEALRGEVWQLLAGCHDDKQIFETYKSLINKDSPCESIIQRDINRTFPAHEQFKEKGGIGQDALFKICKAYSVYDPEVGYCQGLSFLVAALLLHMPEEQAFGVLVKIMFDYHIRDMFRNGFEELHLKFYQLQKLMEDQMPELHAHFADLGIEVHMFASQWFLTLFTAKFPLIVVFFIIDLFLLDAIDMIFQVAVALLMLSKKDLLALDFEGVLKHFRVSLPKKYRTEDSARQLLQTAVKVKVRKLKKYQKEYATFKEQEKVQEDPLQGLQRENAHLRESNMRLEQENDDLAQELIHSKLQLRNDLVKAEEKVEALNKELQATQVSLSEMEEEKRRLENEVGQLKEMCRRELQTAETENARNTSIISDYKQICSQLSIRLEKEQAAAKQNLSILKEKLESCSKCSEIIGCLRPDLSFAKKVSEQDKDSQIQEAERQARELELELAQTKLALVEAECKNQDLTHQLNAAVAELQASKNTWFHKTLSSIRDAAKKDNQGPREGKDNVS